jgi:AraC-like DNA-binding protein
VKEFADKWGINLTSIYRISYLLSDQLGEIKKFKINNNPIEAYSPEQQQIIYKYIAENNYLAPTAPDGYLTVNKVAEELGVNFKTVNRAISALGDSIGKINKYKFSNNITNAYSPEQRLIIKNYIDNRRSST